MLPGWCTQATFSFFTFCLLIWVSGLKRQALELRWYCGQLSGSA